MTATHTQTALSVLNELVDTARETRKSAPPTTPPKLLYAVATLEDTLDAARTTLVQEGDDYLEAAWAFIDAGRGLLATARTNIARAEQGLGWS